MLERYRQSADNGKFSYYAVLIAISIVLHNLRKIELSDSHINELIELWNENSYAF